MPEFIQNIILGIQQWIVEILDNKSEVISGHLNELHSNINELQSNIEENQTEISETLDELQSTIDEKQEVISGHLNELNTGKQDKLTAGTGINIVNNTISSTSLVEEITYIGPNNEIDALFEE